MFRWLTSENKIFPFFETKGRTSFSDRFAVVSFLLLASLLFIFIFFASGIR